MALTTRITVENQDFLAAARQFLVDVLNSPSIDAVMVPLISEGGHSIMPELVTIPSRLEQADPLSPCFAMNAARLVSKLTRKPGNKKIAAVLRPCEVRALVELVKLKQARLDNLIVISMDCLGAYSNKDWTRINASGPDNFTRTFYEKQLTGKLPKDGESDITSACMACEYPVSDQADITFNFLGTDITREFHITGKSDAGETLIRELGLETAELPRDRDARIEDLTRRRLAFRDDMFARTREAVAPLDKLAVYFERCVNCYNCRVACPVCYCRECVFNTDVFDHDPFQYMEKAQRSGSLRLPSDTLFFHITRMAHMSLSCVGCGQCSNACPNEIPVMEVFRLAGSAAQEGFGYFPGLKKDAAPPLSEFKEQEFEEVVGI